jgi:hypothetical protein
MCVAITIPQNHAVDWVDGFFDGTTRQGPENFPVAARMARDCQGGYLYLVYRDRIHGRFLIDLVEYHDPPLSVPVGTEGEVVETQTTIWVTCPGETAGERNIPREGNRNYFYDDVPEW